MKLDGAMHAQLRARRGAKMDASLDSRMLNRRRRTKASEFGPLGHLREHRGWLLVTDNVLRNDNEQDDSPDRSA
ncbi:MAG: hypothetical protein WBM75_16815 [Polyangiales bacterium]